MNSFISSLNRGTPKVSVACDSEKPSASLFLLPSGPPTDAGPTLFW